jgi:hypothetical protein
MILVLSPPPGILPVVLKSTLEFKVISSNEYHHGATKHQLAARPGRSGYNPQSWGILCWKSPKSFLFDIT